MPTSAQSIVTLAQGLLNDKAGVRWPASELVAYINEFQQQCVRVRPDQTAARINHVLVAGHVQTLPDEAQYLIDVPYNANFSPITKVDMVLMDSFSPGWRSQSPSSVVVHFMHDLKNPRAFLVYPPAKAGVGGASVVIEAAMKPVAVTASGPAVAVGNLSVQDDMATSALNWVMFRALSKNAEHANQAALAGGYKAAHDAALGIDSQVAAAPKTGEN